MAMAAPAASPPHKAVFTLVIVRTPMRQLPAHKKELFSLCPLPGAVLRLLQLRGPPESPSGHQRHRRVGALVAEPAPLLRHAVQPGQRHLGSGAGESHSRWNGLAELERQYGSLGSFVPFGEKEVLDAERTKGALVSGGLELPDALCPPPPHPPNL